MKRGFTLIEVLIASMIGGLVLTMAMALYVTSLHIHSTDVGLFELEKDIAQTADLLRADLRETNFSSLVMSQEGSQISFASATPLDQLNNLEVGAFGAPKWQKQVFYALSAEGMDAGFAKLVRYESETSTGLPLPWQGEFPNLDTSHQRVISKNILAPKHTLKPGPSGLVGVDKSGESPGGFLCNFVSRDGQLKTQSPEPELATQLIECQLKVLEMTEQGKTSSAEFTFRVFPRN